MCVVRGVQAGQAQVGVLGKDVDDLHAEIAAVAPGRHDQRGAVGGAGLDGMDVPPGHRGALAEGVAQGGDDGVEGQGVPGLFRVDEAHGITA
ncbi:hypothetical protein G6F65_020767 [Rhizopus arrhizus]|nr:hypothetical protein G6F65_020767 [Rhizopus arrhizus]